MPRCNNPTGRLDYQSFPIARIQQRYGQRVVMLGRHVDYCTIQKTDVSMRAPVPVSQVTPDTHSSHDSDSEEGLTTSNVTQFAHSGSYTGAC